MRFFDDYPQFKSGTESFMPRISLSIGKGISGMRVVELDPGMRGPVAGFGIKGQKSSR